MKAALPILFLLFCFAAKAQVTSPENRIVVIGEASINMPADQVRFIVALESTDSTSIDRVYKKHQDLESKMVRLLQELQLPSEDITYSLFSINKRQEYVDRKRVTFFAGHQNVVFTLRSIDKLSEVQARLIREGFTNFNSVFTSSQLQEHQTEVLEKAVEVAREKAHVLAKASGRSIKRVLKVADTEDTDPVFRNYRPDIVAETADISYNSAQLISIPQTIPVRASVKVVFELK